MLKKTEVPGVMCAGPGIFVNTTENSEYKSLRSKMMNEKRQTEKISELENDINEIKNTLNTILNLLNK